MPGGNAWQSNLGTQSSPHCSVWVRSALSSAYDMCPALAEVISLPVRQTKGEVHRIDGTATAVWRVTWQLLSRLKARTPYSGRCPGVLVDMDIDLYWAGGTVWSSAHAPQL